LQWWQVKGKRVAWNFRHLLVGILFYTLEYYSAIKEKEIMSFTGQVEIMLS
jgi:hypothetical protein